jgi:hypothetical protein
MPSYHVRPEVEICGNHSSGHELDLFWVLSLNSGKRVPTAGFIIKQQVPLKRR